MNYELIKNIHIVSYLVWLASFFVSIYFFFKIRKATHDGKPELMRKERLFSTMGGHLGFLGIFLTGGMMASLKTGPQYGWFNFAQHGWLAWKQVLFFAAMILVFAVVMPGSAKLKRLIKNGADWNDIDQQWSKTFFFSLLVYTIVWINTLLGLQKPF
jgi:hypothetical protein